MINYCPLCNSPGAVFYNNNKQFYYQCNNCYGIYVDENTRPDREAEKSRYEEHNNDINDKKYQNFVSNITSAIMRDFTQNDKGLDFGAGTGPVISKILKDNNFTIMQYDPFFHNNPDLLKDKYDYIVCCEVIEHFYNPKKEFSLLRKMLEKNGKLYCMTDIYNESIDFHKWYYKNDITHVFIYHEKTIHWIKEEFGFLDVIIEGRLITWFN
ncbi:MAG: class I SAM-dependent methyltransferase [Bacteroidales bacterium]|nr:class I SAM-dependent methyltransferase [Bacteroidales bacterium]